MLDRVSPMQVMAETRERNRTTIQRSMIYTSGAGFGANDAARVLRSNRAAAAHVLEGMVEDGLLTKHIGANKKISFNAKGVEWLRRPWRTHTNEELGVKPPTRLGLL